MSEHLQLESEEPTRTPDEFLDWYCWHVAGSGERFHPPDETAEECIEHFEEVGEENDNINVTEFSRGEEHGEHLRAWSEAVEFFCDMKARGFDPVMRTEREIQEAREEGFKPTNMTWEWLENSRYVNQTTPHERKNE